VIERLEALAAARPATRMMPALGEESYGALLREADVMVGNSSSGLIEAPSFGLPVVNVGIRQRGRLRAANVIDVGHGREEIRAGIRRALDPGFRESLRGLVNPYGDGRAAPRIAEVLASVALGPRLIRKRFVDRS
jgi:GDP/UDP-N,N'-diacetylbacillosamine 2-epimerase (hydrolysing)